MQTKKRILGCGLVVCFALVAVRPVAAGYEEGQQFYKQRKYKEAVEEFKAELEVRPNWFYPHYMLGVSQTKLGNLKEAAAALNEAVTVAEDDTQKLPSLLALGTVYLKQKKYAEAEKASTSVLEMKGVDAKMRTKAQVTKGDALLYQGKYGPAAKEYDAAAQAGTSDTLTYKTALAHFQAKNYSKVTTLLKPHVDGGKDPRVLNLFIQANLALASSGNDRAVKDQHYVSARGATETLLKLENSPDNRSLLCTSLLGVRDFAPAIGCYQQVIGERKPPLAADYLNLAQAQTGNNDWSGAIATVDAGIQKTKADAGLFRLLGIAHEKLASEAKNNQPLRIQELEKAVAAHERAVALAASSVNKANLARAQTNLQTARENKEIDELNETILAENAAAEKRNKEIEIENEKNKEFNRIVEQEFGGEDKGKDKDKDKDKDKPAEKKK